MSFVYRCLRTKNPNKPFADRCKKYPDKNGILCKDCLADARKESIFVVMHNEVSKVFGIPFKNQVCVEIDLSGGNKKPESKSAIDDRVRHTKNHLREKMQDLDLADLRKFHNEFGLKCWDKLKKGKNEYSFKYLMIKKVIETMIERSDAKV